MVASKARAVLVVDDDADLLGLVAFALEGEGFSVVTAADGQAGLEEVERETPGLILLDMKMPIMDGWEFARRLHACCDHRVPILVFTAADNARQRAEEIGAVGWIGKPFELDDLIASVSRHLRAEVA